eukprot:4101993-Amphidinium_carterae.1
MTFRKLGDFPKVEHESVSTFETKQTQMEVLPPPPHTRNNNPPNDNLQQALFSYVSIGSQAITTSHFSSLTVVTKNMKNEVILTRSKF